MTTLQGHVSAVRALALSSVEVTSPGSDQQVLLFSGGGRAELKAWRVHCDVSDAPSSRVWYEQLASLSINSRQVRATRKPWRKSHQQNVEPETRCMALSCFRLASDGTRHCVIAACSDASVRCFLFDERQRKFEVVFASGFHEHCVLRVSTVTCDDVTLALTAATDGRVAIWNMNQILQRHFSSTQNSADVTANVTSPSLSVSCHQSGINALDVTAFKPEVSDSATSGCVRVVTGGDDGCLCVSEVVFAADSSDGLHIRRQAYQLNAHAAQITGLPTYC